MSRDSVEVTKRDLIGLLVVADLGAILVAGLGGGLLARAGIDVRFSYAISFIAGTLLLYPVIRTAATLRAKPAPTLVRWATIWIVSLMLGFLVFYPLVLVAIDSMLS